MVKYTVRNNKFLKTVYGTDSGCFGVAAYSLGMIMQHVDPVRLKVPAKPAPMHKERKV